MEKVLDSKVVNDDKTNTNLSTNNKLIAKPTKAVSKK